MYLDPPYVLATRKNRKIYHAEMTDADHERLCEILNQSKAKILLSGYANHIYSERLKNFLNTTIAAYDETGKVRSEILWYNYPLCSDLFDWGQE
jgi:DNA adenine methylase